MKHMIFFLFALAALAALVGQGAAPAAVEAAQLPASHLLEPASRDPLMVEALSWTAVGSLTHARAEHTATLLADGRVLVVGGFASGSALASTEIYDPATGRWSQAAPLQQPRYRHTATLLLDGRVLVAGGLDSAHLTKVEIYDPVSNTWTEAASLTGGATRHTATILADGSILLAGGVSGGLFYNRVLRYDPAANAWATVAPMSTQRADHTATLLAGGQVLLAGGFNLQDLTAPALASAELYNPLTNSWKSVGSMATARNHHTASALPDGRVLVAGGDDALAFSLASAEIYNPASESWTSVPTVADLITPRRHHAATLLANGHLLVSGGDYWGANAAVSSSEVYNPATNAWTNAGNLIQGRRHHTSTLLANGAVLVAGGYNAAAAALSSAAVLDDLQRISSATNDSLNTARAGHTATLLLDGRVLVAGGQNSSDGVLHTAELYDRATNTWTPTGGMNTPRSDHTATLLADGRVLVAAGSTSGGGSVTLSSAEIYDPLTGAWTYTGSLSGSFPGGRVSHTATLLGDGRVLVVGGVDNALLLLDTAELFDPQTGNWSAAASLGAGRTSHTATLLRDGTVLVAGGARAADPDVVELYDAANDTWTALSGRIATPRALHTATLLADGRVLLAGGVTAVGPSVRLASTEIFNPATGAWMAGPPLVKARARHTATLLPGGRVLLTGGYSEIVNLPEVYDPATNTWSALSLGEPRRSYHTATLMPNGRVLAVGGFGSSHLTWTSEIWYNTGHQILWQPVLNGLPPTVALDTPIHLTGSHWRGYGYSGGSSGAPGQSSSNHPVVQIRRIDNEEILWLPTAAFSATAFTSQPLAGIQRGPALVTVFVNGIPSASRVTVVADGFRLHLPLIIR